MSHLIFMQRCFDLARMAKGQVSPNPLVGAVLVFNQKIIGEGAHLHYGDAHAEVNAIQNVTSDNGHLISKSTLYVSLEPCSHHGKTPPCVDLILKHHIPKVVISCLDPNPLVAGQGAEKLKANGVEVIIGVLQAQGEHLIRAFRQYISSNRPYIILKFAQTYDGFIGKMDQRIPISNVYTQYLVHKWRSECDAILIGTNTAALDNPQLTNRLFGSKSPLRIILDKNSRLSSALSVFDDSVPTWIVHDVSTPEVENTKNTRFLRLDFNQPYFLDQLLRELKHAGVSLLLVEGGTHLHQSFIQKNLWDEARILISSTRLGDGVRAPVLKGYEFDTYRMDNNVVSCLKNHKI